MRPTKFVKVQNGVKIMGKKGKLFHFLKNRLVSIFLKTVRFPCSPVHRFLRAFSLHETTKSMKTKILIDKDKVIVGSLQLISVTKPLPTSLI
jgi:hypothetical protein